MLNSQSFEEVTKIAGDFSRGRSYGAGAWGDINKDGYPDLWVGGHFGPAEKIYNRNLFLNKRDGTFIDIVEDVFLVEELKGDFHGSAWADFDNDGDQDLIVLSGGENAGTNHPPDSSPNRLFVNHKGVLRDQASELGIAYDSAKAQVPIWLDFNNDGWLDLFHGSTRRPDGLNPTTIFQQTHSGFNDVGTDLLPEQITQATVKLGALATPSKNSGLDLILTGGIKTILNASTTASFAKRSPSLLRGSTDVAIADFNGDLLMDIYVSRAKEDRLSINTKQGLEDITLDSGISSALNTGAVSVVSGDFDNDMDIDIYVVRARDKKNAPNVLYDNQGDGTFIPVANSGGAAGTTFGDGDAATTADYNLDGFIDLFVTNGARAGFGPQQLFRNQGNKNNWLQIDLEGVISSRDGIGAQVYVTTGEITQRRDQMGGFHRWSQDHQRLHFGLAKNNQVDRIEIHWPSGTIQQLDNISANQILKVREEGTPVEEALPGTRYGTDWDDMLIGTRRKNIFFGQAGNDFLEGGNGKDVLFGGDDRDILIGGRSNDTLFGEQGFDTLSGGSGNDLLNGGNGKDILSGGADNDTLIGEAGKDTLIGDRGKDMLTGGAGEDTFVLALGEGTDTITDFSSEDLIGLANGLGIGELSFVGNNIIVTDTNKILATLIGVETASLQTRQFVLL
ncbi:type I secretion target GGXGXDXXX repeat protein domain protein [Synechococcus sp. PCC 7335]|uniref:CRTAC homolog protein n=1 Tax=Synechococcus sp. (strain ATCC 29403 / PCC 7335) TaxID=91464 RepID=UPI00017EC3F4|nr:CRTAC homolog protein [Synechococcus sp. PCC 7335]EDX85499.1 type I secretion target GGXGXDXXX repeat protein domain protein [Synechococcus sp. PCC 7335]